MNLLQESNDRKYKLLIVFLVIILALSCNKEESLFYEIAPNSIIIIPDIQVYTKSDNSEGLRSIVNFINSNKSNISVCLQTGDLTNNNTLEQWKYVSDCYLDRLDANIIHFECLGNHDYGYNGSSDVRYSNVPWNISYDSIISYGDYNENYVQFVQIGGEEYGILVLEFAIRSETLTWANNILQQYPNNKFILLTHAFLNSEGYMYGESTSTTDSDNPHSYVMTLKENYKNSVQIFNKLSDESSNLKYIICGHSLPKEGFKMRTQMNTHGDPVKIIMVNFQHFANGGNGNIAILNVGTEQKSLDVYSTQTKKCIISLSI